MSCNCKFKVSLSFLCRLSSKSVSGGGPVGPRPLPWRPDGPPCRRKQQRQCRRPCAKGRSNAFVSFCFIQNHVMRGSVAVIGVLHGSSSVALLVCRIFARNGHGCIIAEASGPVQRRKKGVIPHFRAKTVLWPARGSPQARFAPPWRPRAFSCHPVKPVHFTSACKAGYAPGNARAWQGQSGRTAQRNVPPALP